MALGHVSVRAENVLCDHLQTTDHSFDNYGACVILFGGSDQ